MHFHFIKSMNESIGVATLVFLNYSLLFYDVKSEAILRYLLSSYVQVIRKKQVRHDCIFRLYHYEYVLQND